MRYWRWRRCMRSTRCARAGTAVVKGALWLLGAIVLQATLGIVILLHQVPMALAHQAAPVGQAD
jgi:heme A synthase